MTVNTIQLVSTNGKPFSLSSYNASGAAVGTYLPLDKNQVATDTSPKSAKIKTNCYITDIIAGAATGTVEVISDGDKTGILIDFASHQVANAGRPHLRIPIARGTQIAFQVAATLAA